jgi:hypothetical protein
VPPPRGSQQNPGIHNAWRPGCVCDRKRGPVALTGTSSCRGWFRHEDRTFCIAWICVTLTTSCEIHCIMLFLCTLVMVQIETHQFSNSFTAFLSLFEHPICKLLSLLARLLLTECSCTFRALQRPPLRPKRFRKSTALLCQLSKAYIQ